MTATTASKGRFYPLINDRCHHKDHDDDGRVYRAVGHCRNCQSGPYLILVTYGHSMPTGKLCPRCGCYQVSADRLAEDDELPASDPGAGTRKGTPA
jgi:hypothetical protein